jgi:polygalacturonase
VTILTTELSASEQVNPLGHDALTVLARSVTAELSDSEAVADEAAAILATTTVLEDHTQDTADEPEKSNSTEHAKGAVCAVDPSTLTP